MASQQILLNRGLTKKRKKIQGNSRVMLRLKHKKAMSKLRSKGNFVRENPGRIY